MHTESRDLLVGQASLAVDPDLRPVIWAEFVAPVLEGIEPYVQELAVASDADLAFLTDLGSIRASVEGTDWVIRLVDGDRWQALVQRFSYGGQTVWIRGAELADVKAGIAAFADRIPDQSADAEDQVRFTFWQVSNRTYQTGRKLAAPAWTEIRGNYPDPVAAKLDELMAADLGNAAGRLILWHGPPGTGKTTAIRALARAWQESCSVEVLLDPERVFGSSSALFHVIAHESDGKQPWRLLVVEDADELIRADAKERVGQALARLLNLGDGLLGQGLQVMTLITTNEPIRWLHPALIRPGRCLADIDFRPFTRAEAKRRWPSLATSAAEVSLAEALHRDANGSAGPEPATGLYL